MNILQSQAEIVGSQFLVKIYNIDTRPVPKEVFEVFAAGGEDNLVGPEDLTLADQGDVNILAGAEVLAEGAEHSAPLLRLKTADNVTGGVNHHVGRDSRPSGL